MSSSLSANLLTDDDVFSSDPSHVDPEFPPHFTQFCVDSGGSRVSVKMWLAGGRGDKGTLIISPPMGGTDWMNSVVIPLMYAGIHVIIYRPRGIRDPENVYNLARSIDDIHAIIDWIVANSGSGNRAPFGPTLRLDPSRICMFGLSGGGGNNSFVSCAESKYADYAMACSPANPEIQMTPQAMEEARSLYRMIKESTLGRTDWEAWINAMSSADKKRISIISNASKLVDKHLLMLGASNDAISPNHIAHEPIMKALRDAGVKDLTELIFETDHAFLSKRYSLPRVMIAWLKSQGF